MPYELETDKSHKFLSATQIAILLSFGLHFLIYIYGFPISLFKKESSNKEQMVSTIELSPLEQARLPNLDSQWNIPEFNNTPLDEAAPPFALPLPPNFTPSNDLPAVSIPPGYSFPNIPPISSDIELPPLGITDLSSLPLPPPVKDLDSIIPPDVPLTTPEEATEEKPTEESITPPPEPPPEPEKPESDKPSPEQIAAVREQKLKGNLRAVSKSIQKQDGETTDEEARKNYVAWLSKIENAEPESVEIKGIYPKDACIRRLEGQSIYGVVVDANNEVVALELIKGAKYPIFNEKASEDIQKHDFANETNETNETQKVRPYQVTVDYKYDAEICPSLTLPSLRKQEETAPKPKTDAVPKPESQPQPKPEAETKPQPQAKPESQPQTEAESKPQPKPESQPQPEAGTETKPESQPLPSLRERLQNTPLPDDNTIRERLRRNPLPKK